MSAYYGPQGGGASNWYEVWADEGPETPYLLILRPHAGGFEIRDPAEGNRQVSSFANYEDAKNWLLEDELVFVGRKVVYD